MRTDTLEELLTKIKDITEREEQDRKIREERGEYFNIFEILRCEKDEIMHSRMIGELLNPNGTHGCNDLFLKVFLERILPDFPFQSQSAKVYTEFFIDWKNYKETEGGRIDILLEDSKHNAIIIENKIYANDQPRQLERYENYAKKQNCPYRILYLTLDGTLASDRASKKQDVIYTPISYREHILDWLEKCLVLAEQKTSVKAIIFQYIDIIKEILNTMNEENQKALVEICTQENNVKQTLAILMNAFEIETNIRRQFINKIKEYALSKGLKCYEDNDLSKLEKNSWINLYNPDISNNWGIRIGAYDYTQSHGGVLYGIGVLKFCKFKVTKKSLKEYSSLCGEIEREPDQDFPIGSYYLHDENKNEYGTWCRNVYSTLEDMINDKMLNFIKHEVIDKALESKLIDKVEEISSTIYKR